TSSPALARRRPVEAAPGEAWEQIADKPNLDVVLGHPGDLRREDADFIAALLANSVLGASTLSSRLGQRIRDREGLTYGVISRFFGASLVDGPWAITFSVAQHNLKQALAAAREEVERLLQDGPEETELADEREAMAGTYRLSLATPGGLARELSRLARHRLPLAKLDELPGEVLGTSREAVLAAARRHLSPAQLSMAVAGDLVDPRSEPD
ncbi:MAG: insulinase family protein, partial [Acidobacteriota bacterium]